MIFPKNLLYKNMKAMVCSLDGDTDFFDLVSRGFQGNTATSFLFIIYLDYVLQTSRDLMKKWSHTKKEKNRQYPTETIMDADKRDDLILPANIPALAKSLLHSLEQADRSIGLIFIPPDKIWHKVFLIVGIRERGGCAQVLAHVLPVSGGHGSLGAM